MSEWFLRHFSDNYCKTTDHLTQNSHLKLILFPARSRNFENCRDTCEEKFTTFEPKWEGTLSTVCSPPPAITLFVLNRGGGIF